MKNFYLSFQVLGLSSVMIGCAGKSAKLPLAPAGPRKPAAQDEGSPLENIQGESPYLAKMAVPHEAKIINSGPPSLENTLSLIDSAQRTIEYEMYSLGDGTHFSLRLVFQGLCRRAQEGLRVRVLLDYHRALDKPAAYAALFKNCGAQVRFINNGTAGFNYRNHRKMLVVDDERVVMGGRNLYDQYFFDAELPTRPVELDREIELKGPIVKQVRASFDAYWNSRHAAVVDEPLPDGPWSKANKKTAPYWEVKDILTPNERDCAVRAQLREFVAKHPGDTSVSAGLCREVTFVTDEPGQGKRYVGDEFLRHLDGANASLWLETSTFAPTPEIKRGFDAFLKRGGHLSLLTNDLANENFIGAAVINSNVIPWVKRGASVFTRFPVRDEEQMQVGQGMDRLYYMTHAKSVVIDENSVMVGSFNYDGRSQNINSELAVFCDRSPELARQIIDDMKMRVRGTVQLAPDGKAYFKGAPLRRRLMYPVLRPLFKLIEGQL